MNAYALYGLTVHADGVIAGLHPAAHGASADLTITLGTAERLSARWSEAPVHYQWSPAPDEPPGVDVRRAPDGAFWFRYPDATEFTIDASATRVDAWWSEHSTLEDTCAYLLGPVMGFALRLRGVLALHASAVLIDGRAVALVGQSGAGKSTTAAAFAAAGYPVLADDVLAIRSVDGVLTAYPSYRLLRLWSESEAMLFGTVGELPRLTPTWDKRALHLGEAFPFHQQPAALGDVFLFGARVEASRAPFVEPLSARDALLELVVNTYANYLLNDAMRAEELMALQALLRARRVRRLVPHTDAGRLPALVEAVCAAARAP